MQTYRNKSMEQLAADLTSGLVRLRKGYIDAAEALCQILNPQREYPYEFVVFRITGYRGRRSGPPSPPMSGESLRADLLRLILDVSESYSLHTDDYAEVVYDTDTLARRFNVSTKTLQRWRKNGLSARKLVFPDGKRRVAFLDSSVRWFVDNRKKQIVRSMHFTQLTDAERLDIIRRAKRMACFSQCCLSDIARRLASKTGRAVETIRYTIRKHDLEHPQEAVFPYLSAPLGDQEKNIIYRCFLRGVPVSSLADRYGRTRGSIYRIVNEMRARQLINRPINYIDNAEFDDPDADHLILQQPQARDEKENGKVQKKTKAPADLPSYLKALYDVPLLNAQQEQHLFRAYNYLKYKADKLRSQLDVNRIRTSQLRRVEKFLLQANVLKNRIVRANLRLVVSIAKKHLRGPQTLFELISDGNVSLMRAVEKFDYGRGHRFSTYASWAIMRNYARSVPKEQYQLDRFSTGHEEVLDIAASLRSYDPNEVNIPELRESIDALLTQLTARERTILIDHYGLDETRRSKTLDELGRQLGLSKERVRQIEIQALRKLRKIIHPQKADFMI